MSNEILQKYLKPLKKETIKELCEYLVEWNNNFPLPQEIHYLGQALDERRMHPTILDYLVFLAERKYRILYKGKKISRLRDDLIYN